MYEANNPDDEVNSEGNSELTNSGIFAYESTKRGITQQRKFSINSQNSLCTLKTGRCKYRTYREKLASTSSSSSAKSKLDFNPEEESSEDELDEFDYEEFEKMQSDFLQANLIRVETILKELTDNIDGEETTS